MATGSGLDAQLGAKLETTVGTPVTVDKFFEFNSESLVWTPTWLEPTGLRVGTKYKRVGRVVQSRKTVAGSLEMEHATRLMGLWWKLALGSAVTTPTADGAGFKQIHTPGDHIGKSATIQVGRPEPGGTVRAHTYAGCKVTGWEFTVGDNEIATLSLDIDGWDESTVTALATASYPTGAGVWGFHQATTFTLGGTASTASGEVSIAGGTAVATVIKRITIRGAVPMADDRYGIGNQGIKREQLENDTPTITITLDAEYSKAELYDVFKAGTTTALQLAFTGAVIGAGPETDLLSFIAPAIKLKTAPPAVDGPDVVRMSVEAEVYSDETNAPFQVKIRSADSAAL